MATRLRAATWWVAGILALSSAGSRDADAGGGGAPTSGSQAQVGPADTDQARARWAASCQGEVAAACTDLAASGLNQPGIGPERVEQGFRELLALCRLPHAPACRELGLIWLRGDGRDPNVPEAQSWFHHASLRGDGPSAGLMGLALRFTGPADLWLDQAVATFQAGCSRHGDRLSCAELHGATLAQGEQAPPSQRQAAVQALEQGCAQGEVPACVNLGRVRLRGQGQAPDPIAALSVLGPLDAPGVEGASRRAAWDPSLGEGLALLARALQATSSPAATAEHLAALDARACRLGYAPVCP